MQIIVSQHKNHLRGIFACLFNLLFLKRDFYPSKPTSNYPQWLTAKFKHFLEELAKFSRALIYKIYIQRDIGVRRGEGVFSGRAILGRLGGVSGIFWLVYIDHRIPYLQSQVGFGWMQDKDAEEAELKPVHYSERTADRPQDPAEHPDAPAPVLFLDQQTTSTRSLNLALPEMRLRPCYRMHSSILQGSPISQNMRARLRSFLMGESSKQLLLRETCVLACNFVDLFFAQGGRVEVSEFQSLVIGCLILASKIKEGKFPTIAFNIFSREQLLAYQKKVARRLAYNLAPPTYHDYAHRVALLWDHFAPCDPRFAVPFTKCPTGVNLRLRRFYEQLDCVFLVLKSLDFELEALVVGLFYLHARMANLPLPSEHPTLSDEKFKTAFYPSNDQFKKHFEKFLEVHAWSVVVKLEAQMGVFLRPFLAVEPAQRQWMIRGNEQALEMMRVWDRIQTSPKDNYQLAKGVIERAGQAKKK